jgi:hypothetical protein
LAASAQDGVSRERLTFIGNTLEIEVLVEVPGTLRLIQGRLGEVDVTARALSGIAGAALSGADHATLQLSAVGAERVEYLVAVPEGAQVRIRLPGRPLVETLGTLQKTAVYTWDGARGRNEGGR